MNYINELRASNDNPLLGAEHLTLIKLMLKKSRPGAPATALSENAPEISCDEGVTAQLKAISLAFRTRPAPVGPLLRGGVLPWV